MEKIKLGRLENPEKLKISYDFYLTNGKGYTDTFKMLGNVEGKKILDDAILRLFPFTGRF